MDSELKTAYGKPFLPLFRFREVKLLQPLTEIFPVASVYLEDTTREVIFRGEITGEEGCTIGQQKRIKMRWPIHDSRGKISYSIKALNIDPQICSCSKI